MTERKPPDMSFRSWIDQQINEAAERGAFADLPGAGKPLPSKGDEDAAEAWLREYVRREGVSTEEFLPVPLKLRKERERTPSAESVLAAGDMAFLDRLWQDWSPGYDASENLRSVKQCLRGEGNLAAAIGYYRAGEPGLRRPGADGPDSAYAAEEQALAGCGPQPTLYLHGNRDGCIDLSLVRDAGRHLAAGSSMEVVPDAGHFLQVEKPAAVNDRILAWVSG